MELEKRVDEAMFRQLISNASIPLIGSAVGSLLIAFSQKGPNLSPWVIGWLCLFYVTLAIRVWLTQRCKIQLASTGYDSRAAFRYALTLSFSGLIWGLSGLLIIDASPMSTVITTTTIQTLVMGGVLTLGAFTPAFLAFAIPAILPIIFVFAWSGGTENFVLSFYCASFLALMISIAFRYNKSLRNSWQITFEKEYLIDNLREAKETAEAATRLKDQFVTLISHDLRSPLLSIKGMLDLAKAESPEGLLEMGRSRTFERIANSAEGLITLTERLLDYSRLQTGDIQPRMSFINIRALAEEVMARIAHLATLKNITVHNAIPEDMHIYADPDLYGQVIHNILSNALKFTHHGGEVTILSKDDSTLIIRDNGIGIDEKMLADLFDSEVKTSAYGTDGEKGTGIGLPYSYNIMQAHGGDLVAMPMKNAGQSIGAEFHIILPKHTSLVLIADDLDIQRAIMKDMIAKLHDVQVVEARNGAEALEMLQYITPTIIVTDVQMPVMDGYELVRQIRNLPQFEMIPIMAVTSFAGADYSQAKDKLQSLGADDIMSKPLVEDEFLKVVAKYIGQNR